jgi:mono/diheme cytochrome c family protein
LRLVKTLTASVLLASAAVSAATSPSSVTYYKQLLPVLQKNCQNCHRPGEAAPMSFLTYEQTRPWAKAMKQAVLTKKMPPWFADPHYGKFANDRTLSQAEIDTIVAWADSGANAGDPKDAPKPIEFLEGWNIGKPDAVFQMPAAFEIPASGTLEYQYIVIPTNFTEDKWVERAEVRPANRALVHHVIAFLREPGSKWMADAKPGVPFIPEKRGGGGGANDTLSGYAPGMVPEIQPAGTARLVKAGSDIVLQMHYTANGKPGTDITRVGIVFAKEPPKQRVAALAVGTNKFVIPAGDPDHRVDAELTLQEPIKLLSFLPHMHLRGKSFEYRLVLPDGEKQTLLNVPRYDFNWQLTYTLAEPMMLPKGTKIECTAHYDNSANNPSNPDPAKEVRYGDQSWEEMMFGFFSFALDPTANPVDVVRPRRGNAAPKPTAE